ncbi:MAG: alpha/beta hydrolase [Bacteroidales bacterium]
MSLKFSSPDGRLHIRDSLKDFMVAFSFVNLIFNTGMMKHSNTSTKSKILYHTLKSINFSGRVFNRLLNNPKRNTSVLSPARFKKKLNVEKTEIDGFNVLTMRTAEASNGHIIFLHGGAYIAEAVKGHRYLIEKFALSDAFKVSFIDYPLAPENNALTTLRIVAKAYREIINSNPQDTIFLLGDSAGGGLALALLQLLKKNSDTGMPLKTALLSPWLDISMSNPDMINYIDTDILLNVKGLIECGKLYADQLDVKDPMVSPLFGNLENLSQIKIWVSDYELFYPDCVLLNKKLNAADGSKSSLIVKEKMIHDWIIFPIRERDETIVEIADFFHNGS